MILSTCMYRCIALLCKAIHVLVVLPLLIQSTKERRMISSFDANIGGTTVVDTKQHYNFLISSFRFKHEGANHSNWEKKFFNTTSSSSSTSTSSSLSISSTSSFSSQKFCSFSMLGFTTHSKPSDMTSTLLLLLPSFPSLQHELLQVVCQVIWMSENAVAITCPLQNSSVCARLQLADVDGALYNSVYTLTLNKMNNSDTISDTNTPPPNSLLHMHSRGRHRHDANVTAMEVQSVFKPRGKNEYFINKTSTPPTPPPSAPSPPSLGVCMVITYGNVHDSAANRTSFSSIMLSALEHYQRLDMHVMLYDILGTHAPYIEEYMNLQHTAHNRLSYFNYTILQVLNRVRKPNPKFTKISDIDKYLTHTHCRMELANMYGIEQVLVVDCDEFLYCPHSRANYASQRQGVRALVASVLQPSDLTLTKLHDSDSPDTRWLDLADIGEVRLQRVSPLLIDQHSSSQECFSHAIANNMSLFGCFHSKKYLPVMSPNLKLFHLRHTCPWTMIHRSCSAPSAHTHCSCGFTRNYICSLIHIHNREKFYHSNNEKTSKPLPNHTEDRLELLEMLPIL